MWKTQGNGALYRGNTQAMEAVQNLRDEIILYKKHPSDYSYVFYAMKKK